MNAPEPSFLRFMICCPFGLHRPVECECCGAVSCLDCRMELDPPRDGRSELQA